MPRRRGLIGQAAHGRQFPEHVLQRGAELGGGLKESHVPGQGLGDVGPTDDSVSVQVRFVAANYHRQPRRTFGLDQLCLCDFDFAEQVANFTEGLSVVQTEDEQEDVTWTQEK